ncbi:hypothetical protein J1614_007853 [Plenodomus biglobosus]|nr:hypothetical protein J1614_007853 [Plenodomus biglobosus]
MSQSQTEALKKAEWYEENPTDDMIPQETRQLLETYSGVPAKEVFNHVVRARDEAFEIFPYPCIGQFRFLEPSFSELEEEYNEMVKRLSEGQKLLDMACCFGQTIRQLVAGGAPSENIYGSDLQSEFIELGYKLFKDQSKLKTKFLVADIFDPNSALTTMKGEFDMVFAGSFFHLWGYEKQTEVSKAVAALLRTSPGSMILGRQIGAITAVEKTSATGTMYRHNVESFRKMWEDIGKETGVNFSVKAELKELAGDHFMLHTDDTRRLWFVVRRE